MKKKQNKTIYYYILKDYFIQDEEDKEKFTVNSKIEVFNKDKSIIETIQKARDDLKDLEIQETEEEIINWKGENIFKKDIYDEWLIELKNNKLNKLNQNCNEYILKNYSITTQINIIADEIQELSPLKKENNKFNDYKQFILDNVKTYKEKKQLIEKATNEEEIEKIYIDFK